ncbi:MAG: cob(I)yrinic acid a,c-diamide adenosyltransferase [Brevinematales bacterium]|nr:cob(I)yrinic acid a,c-diamide adenosyltransferase [Brevinematales bacterium]
MEKKLKIYTKIGDSGETYTLGGVKLGKDHIKIDVYGDIDELTSWIGVILSHIDVIQRNDERVRISEFLRLLQNRLFDTGTLVMGGNIEELDIWTAELEKEIDYIEDKLKPIKSFILPGGSKVASFVHIARCVCRRVERKVVSLSKSYEIDKNAIKYLNRLSDYFFVLARYLNYLLGVEDIKREESIYIKKKMKIKPKH